jgi:hypothetical protein
VRAVPPLQKMKMPQLVWGIFVFIVTGRIEFKLRNGAEGAITKCSSRLKNGTASCPRDISNRYRFTICPLIGILAFEEISSIVAEANSLCFCRYGEQNYFATKS